jgi:hypothetical protein
MSELRELFGENVYYFRLMPSPDRINWVQLSFSQLSADWPPMPNPVPNFRNEIIIDELSPLCYDFQLQQEIDLPFDKDKVKHSYKLFLDKYPH